MLVEAFYRKPFRLSEEALAALKPFRKIALFGSVQFIQLDEVIHQLKTTKKEILTSHGKRTSGNHQLLGCDCFQDSFSGKDIFKKADIILYIGDGLFHPKALLFCQLGSKNPKDIVIFDPINNAVKKITRKDIEAQIKTYKANLIKFMAAEKIGILVSTKTGQSYLKNAAVLQKELKAKGKESFIFVDDTIDLSQMENFPFVEAWVNTACPRIGFDDLVHYTKPLININDAFTPEKAVMKYG